METFQREEIVNELNKFQSAIAGSELDMVKKYFVI